MSVLTGSVAKLASDTLSTAVDIKCDWVTSLRNSGAENALASIIGNAIGFVQAYWGYIIIIAIVVALVTLVLGRQHNARWIRIAMWTAIVAVVLVPLINFGSNLAPSTC